MVPIQVVNSFTEDENYILIVKFIIPVANDWPELRASTVKWIKARMMSTMKTDLEKNSFTYSK